MSGYPVNGCTDVTGFGLLGHALEMARGSKVRIVIFAEKVPLLPEALDAVGMGLVPGGSFSNRNFCSHQLVGADRIDPMLLDILSDAQTSGGLLISLPEPLAESFLAELKAGGVADAAIVGRAVPTDKPTVELS
jgi:selenide,water dikinase